MTVLKNNGNTKKTVMLNLFQHLQFLKQNLFQHLIELFVIPSFRGMANDKDCRTPLGSKTMQGGRIKTKQ